MSTEQNKNESKNDEKPLIDPRTIGRLRVRTHIRGGPAPIGTGPRPSDEPPPPPR